MLERGETKEERRILAVEQALGCLANVEACVQNCLREVLVEGTHGMIEWLPATICHTLLRETANVNEYSQNQPSEEYDSAVWPSQLVYGPLYRRLGSAFVRIMHGKQPVVLPRMKLLVETSFTKLHGEIMTVEKLSPSCDRFCHHLHRAYRTEDGKGHMMLALKSLVAISPIQSHNLALLCVVRTLLGMRTTIGSTLSLPYCRDQLLMGFCKMHKKGCQLSVGARALVGGLQSVNDNSTNTIVLKSKHSNRSTDGWWGDAIYKGNDTCKNAVALEVLTKIFDSCVW